MRPTGSRIALLGILTFLFALAACKTSEPRAPAIGEAYAGPATLALRKDIPLQSPAVATVKHGERLEIVQRRRRFLKVRAPGSAEGWIEDHLLLVAEEIATLKEVERRTDPAIAGCGEHLRFVKRAYRTEPVVAEFPAGEGGREGGCGGARERSANAAGAQAADFAQAENDGGPQTYRPQVSAAADAPRAPRLAAQLEGSFENSAGRGTGNRRKPGHQRAASGRLEPGAQCKGRKRMGPQPASLHGNSR